MNKIWTNEKGLGKRIFQGKNCTTIKGILFYEKVLDKNIAWFGINKSCEIFKFFKGEKLDKYDKYLRTKMTSFLNVFYFSKTHYYVK
jgi:hypothetical protein